MAWTREEAIAAVNTELLTLAAANSLTVDWPGTRLAADTAEFIRPTLVSAAGAAFRQANEHGSGEFIIDIFARPQASGNAYRIQEIADILCGDFNTADLDLTGGNLLRFKEGVFSDFGKDPEAPEYFRAQVRWEYFIVP